MSSHLINLLKSHLINLLENKLSETINDNISNNFARYKAQPLRSGMVCCPSLNVDIEQVNVLREYDFNQTRIANIMDIHRSTLGENFKNVGITFKSNIQPYHQKS